MNERLHSVFKYFNWLLTFKIKFCTLKSGFPENFEMSKCLATLALHACLPTTHKNCSSGAPFTWDKQVQFAQCPPSQPHSLTPSALTDWTLWAPECSFGPGQSGEVQTTRKVCIYPAPEHSAHGTSSKPQDPLLVLLLPQVQEKRWAFRSAKHPKTP